MCYNKFIMKIGISLDGFANKHGRYNENKFNKVRSHGFEAVDYSMQNTDTIIYTCSNDELKQLMQTEKTSAQNAGVVISQVHGPWRYPPKDDTVEDRQERLEKMNKVKKQDITKVCKKIRMDTVFLLEGVKNEDN